MLGIGGTELVIILIFGFILFGPDKLPQMGRTIGRAIRQFQNAQEEMSKVVKAEVYDPLTDDEPLKNITDIFKDDKDKATKSTTDKKAATKSTSSSASSKATDADKTKETSAPAAETFAEKRARLARERAEAEREEGSTTAEKLYGLADSGDASTTSQTGEEGKPEA